MLLTSIYSACIKTIVLEQMVKAKLDWQAVLFKQLCYVLRFLVVVNFIEYGVEMAIWGEGFIHLGDYLLMVVCAAYLASFAVVQYRLLKTKDVYLYN